MSTYLEWIETIKNNGGKIGGTINGDSSTDMIDGYWFYHNPEDYQKKFIRDKISREMRKDNWSVKTETNSLGYHFRAIRKKV